jgi:hypothetical protein
MTGYAVAAALVVVLLVSLFNCTSGTAPPAELTIVSQEL